MSRILIIKTGASGDVVRTTVLLHLFKNDEIVWLTSEMNKPLLPQNIDNLKIISIEEFNPQEYGFFDLVVSLEDDFICASLASQVDASEVIGIYVDNKEIKYKAHDTTWFDMGLVSKYGKQKADELKKINKESYQTLLYRMFNKEFNGEEYLISKPLKESSRTKLIGLEARAGNRWPTKVWNGFSELNEQLNKSGFDTYFFENRNTMIEFIDDISKCSVVVTGDTLTLHLSLALKLPTVGLFTCTSPTEIYDYGRLTKIVSPKLNEAFYTNEYKPEVLDAILMEDVMSATLNHIN